MESRRFLVHLRRPNKLSTVQLADTQPFFHDGDFAFCHNGFLSRAETLRPPTPTGCSAVPTVRSGGCSSRSRLEAGVKPIDALAEVDETFQGKVNLGYLGADGTLALYTHNRGNAMWQFEADGADVVSTSVTPTTPFSPRSRWSSRTARTRGWCRWALPWTLGDGA